MKSIARDVVKDYFKDELFPNLGFDHNSQDLLNIVKGNVENVLNESRFHMGLTPDDYVSSYNTAHPITLTVYILGPYREL
jgi:hypothetical protein